MRYTADKFEDKVNSTVGKACHGTPSHLPSATVTNKESSLGGAAI
jgi:hypothetical protein